MVRIQNNVLFIFVLGVFFKFPNLLKSYLLLSVTSFAVAFSAIDHRDWPDPKGSMATTSQMHKHASTSSCTLIVSSPLC
jgi:hypothetical protein